MSREWSASTMKWIIIWLCFLLMPVLLFCTDYKIIDTSNGDIITLEQLVKKLLEYDVIFFGQPKCRTLTRGIEFDLMRELYEADEGFLAISLEKLDRTAQPVLNDYIREREASRKIRIDTEQWKRFLADHHSIIRYAKTKHIPVIAANAPRRLVESVSREGIRAFHTMSDSMRRMAAQEILTPDDEYKELYLEKLAEELDFEPEYLEAKYMYAAQCLKDDTMAESILNYHRRDPRKRILHFNDSFYSNSYLGTVRKLKNLKSDLAIVVISTAFKPLTKDDLKSGDFLILLDIVVTD